MVLLIITDSQSLYGLETRPNFKMVNKWAAIYVEPYLTPCTSFVLGLLIFKGAVRRKNSLSQFWFYLEVLLK